MATGIASENYDQRGRLWRSWSQFSHGWDPKKQTPVPYGVLIKDHISGHSTTLYIDPVGLDPSCTPEQFNIRFLISRIK